MERYISAMSVCASAARAGSRFAGSLLRSSSRSFSGLVAVCSFSSRSVARRFSAVWAGRVGVFCVVRRVGRVWAVSVPVSGFWAGVSCVA